MFSHDERPNLQIRREAHQGADAHRLNLNGEAAPCSDEWHQPFVAEEDLKYFPLEQEGSGLVGH